MQENNDRQEQKVARRTYMAHALLTALVVNITWLVDVSIRLLVYLNLKTFFVSIDSFESRITYSFIAIDFFYVKSIKKKSRSY